MRKAILLVITGLIIKNGLSQSATTTHWLTVQLPVIFNKHWQWYNEGSYRTIRESGHLNQLFLRTGVRYTFNDHWNLAACADLVFARLSPDKSEDSYGRETRLWQEVNHQLPLHKKFFLQNRIRIEERFFGETDKNEAYNAMRFRYRLGIVKEINNKWSIQLADEVMEQLQDTEWQFNQNRVITGAIYQLGPHAQLQATYLWTKRSSGSQHSGVFIFQKRILAHAKRNQS